jgi:hypothetical protein
VDFTREPIIESVITPRDGCKLVVRSSKGVGQEEYFVDALEMVSFGGCFFFRSVERPKAFLVPVSDYEVLEARETRMVLKTRSGERGAIKIGGGRTTPPKEKPAPTEEPKAEKSARTEKKRRRTTRRRRGREEEQETTEEQGVLEEHLAADVDLPESSPIAGEEEEVKAVVPTLSALLPPPTVLIKDSIAKYREDEQFNRAFYDSDPVQAPVEAAPEAHSSAGHQEEAAEQAESDDPFGEGDGLEESGEVDDLESDPFTIGDSHWVIPGPDTHEPQQESANQALSTGQEEPVQGSLQNVEKEVSNQPGSQQ